MKKWLNFRLIGVIIAILYILFISLSYQVSHNIVYNDEEFISWGNCENDVRVEFESIEHNVFGQEREDLLQETIFQECGEVPRKNLSDFRDSMMRKNGALFDSAIGMFISPFLGFIHNWVLLIIGLKSLEKN